MIEIHNSSITKPNHNLHLIAPYVGKIRPALGQFLVKTFCVENGVLWDPFAGSGTIPLEGWLNGQNVYASDLNLYAHILTKGKLNPPQNVEEAIQKIDLYQSNYIGQADKQKYLIVDDWVKEFFHENTLKEIISWTNVLKHHNEWFLLSCLMGILHHQRPGFLSYPSSHGAPYLRLNKYPKDLFPHMYEYRDVYSRLVKKVKRVLTKMPSPRFDLVRDVNLQNSYDRIDAKHVNTIITSPPYMKALTYARDNRLRLWFLDEKNWKELDNLISPNKIQFEDLMNRSLSRWSQLQKTGDYCIIIIGDIIYNKKKELRLSELISAISKRYGYHLSEILVDPIPEERKVVKGNVRIKNENVCIFQKQ